MKDQESFTCAYLDRITFYPDMHTKTQQRYYDTLTG